MLILALDEKIKWHRNNQNDPHSIGTAVICALEEVKSSVEQVKSQESNDRDTLLALLAEARQLLRVNEIYAYEERALAKEIDTFLEQARLEE